MTLNRINTDPDLLSDIQAMKDALLEDGMKGSFDGCCLLSIDGVDYFLVDERGEIFEAEFKE